MGHEAWGIGRLVGGSTGHRTKLKSSGRVSLLERSHPTELALVRGAAPYRVSAGARCSTLQSKASDAAPHAPCPILSRGKS